MATWAAKAPGEVVTREWVVPVPEDDSVASYSASVSGATKDSDERDGDTVFVTISGGTDGATATATLSAVTTNGLTLQATYYLPIQATTNAFAYTALDVCQFAMDKIAPDDLTGRELERAVERLNDMLAEWVGMGADTGIPLPVTSTDTLYCSDAFVSAIKHNLRVACHDHYGQPIDATDARAAMRGLQVIKTANLPADRAGSDYY